MYHRYARMREQNMPEVFAGTIGEIIESNDRKVIRHGDLEIGVLHRNGEFFAYRNHCVHQGGPACEGMIIAKVEDVVLPDRTVSGQRFSDTEIHFVCPWHGVEYDLSTGACVPNPKRRLQKFNVVQKGNEVYVVV
jgi:nitrite reductase/ring-hydroxylating ferredoxin subunit